MTSTPQERARLHAWEAELDRLQLETLRLERVARGLDAVPIDPWQPPGLAGPIPAELLERAAELLRRQERVRAELVAALDAARQQATYTAQGRRPHRHTANPGVPRPRGLIRPTGGDFDSTPSRARPMGDP